MIVTPMPSLESATLTVWVRVGSRNEEKERGGVSHFLEHVVFKGGKKYKDAQEVSHATDSIGAESNAGTSQEWTNFYIKCQASKMESAFDILSDILLYPKLTEQDIDVERGVILEEIAMKNDNPMDKIGDIFADLIFEGNPLSWDISGSKETVTNIKRQDFVDFRRGFYTASNIVITVSGGVEVKEIENITKKYFSKLKPNTIKDPIKFVASQNKPKLKVEYKKGEQAHLILGFLGHHRRHPDRYAEGLLATILGRGMSSRLFTEIREKRGLAYAVGTSISRFIDTGVFDTYAGVNPNKAEETIKVILDQSYGVRDGKFPIKKKELDKAKEYIKGKTALALEDTSSVNDYIGQRALFLPKIDTPHEYFKKIDKVTVEEVYKAAKDIFRPEKLNLAIIGPYKSQEQFEKLLGNRS